jgi:gliding motility-associated-like protein
MRFTGSYANANCYDTTNLIPLTIKGPVAGYKIATNNVCFNNPAVLQDTSVSFGGTIQKWEWNFGDGQTSTNTQGGTLSHTYSAPGNYWVSLRVTDNSGCQATGTTGYIAPVQVNGPKAAFSASATTTPLAGTVNFTNNTNTSNTSNVTYKWQIDGVDFSTNANSSYTFNQPGTYTITLMTTDPGSGCTSTAAQVITVKDFNAAFSLITTAITPNSCPPVLVRFTNNSSNYSKLIWDFGDGTVIENGNSPSHLYEKAGKYKITLSVYGPNGVSGTFYDSVTILQADAVIQSSALDVCKGTNITLNAKATNTGSYVWDFGDGSVLSTTDTFANHQYATPGVYSPALITKQAITGCTGSVPLPDKINVRPDPVVTFSPAQPVVCKGASVPLQASGGVTYEWLPATDLSDATIANPVASPVQTSSYKVKVADDLGCTNTADLTITVIQPVTVSVTGDPEICQGESVDLKAVGAAVYKWINDISGLNDRNIANPVATPGATTTYTVTGSDANSCFTDKADITIQVRPLPTVNAGQDVQQWAGEPVQLQATGSSDVINWKWTPADYLSCIDCASPVCTPLKTNAYAVTVKTQYGCAASDTVVVKLLCDENKVRIPNGFTPNGDGRNDEFIIKGIGMVKHLVIFNRWGQKVFERSNFVAGDRSLCWNGSFNGYAAEAGTYVYFVELECPEGSFSKKGTMTLVR